MSAAQFSDLLERGLGQGIPVRYSGARHGGRLAKDEALDSLRRLQGYIGYLLIASAAAGTYLLATDRSIWILAVSHAAGLVMIVFLDSILGVMSLAGSRRVYLPTLAAAFLGIVLQLGDISTGPQYGMSMAYFASYLFGVVAFDVLLVLQMLVLVLGIAGRSSVDFLASKRRVRRELNYSRRSFVTTMAGFAALVGFGVALGSIRVPQSASSPTSSAPAASSTTPITNTSSLQVNTPVYFDYPSGYPNVLFKRSDGTLAAFSTLCTHVCCETSYEASSGIFLCPCHGSEFDSSGNVIRGPAATPLPQISLTVDSSGNVFPTGVSGSTPC